MNNLSEIYLITEELLKLYSNITRNVGVNKVFPYVGLAQSFYIQPILGKPLLEELQIQIADNTLTDVNKALILKLAPALSLWTEFLALRGLAYTITEKGITKESSDNSDPISDKDLVVWKTETENMAEMATTLLKEYLCECRDNYPLLPSDICCKKVKRHSHIFFPKEESQCGCGCK